MSVRAFMRNACVCVTFTHKGMLGPTAAKIMTKNHQYRFKHSQMNVANPISLPFALTFIFQGHTCSTLIFFVRVCSMREGYYFHQIGRVISTFDWHHLYWTLAFSKGYS